MENLKASNVGVTELLGRLKEWDERKCDFNLRSNQIYMEGGMLQFTTRPEIIEPSRPMITQIASKLKIPQRYYDYMVEEGETELLDKNVTTWFKSLEADHKNMIRSYNPLENGGVSVGRALLSNKYKIIDHTAILTAVLVTIMKSGMNIKVENADITERKMHVRFMNPDAIVSGSKFLENYKNPETGENGSDGGIMAGFILNNSETGFGSYSILPRAIIGACTNGIIWYDEAKRKTHIGAALDEGDIDWSTSTKQKNMELIMSQMEDYIYHFSSVEYLKTKIDALEGKASQDLLYPIEATQNICGLLDLSEEQTSEVLNYFSKSGDTTYGGVGQALTYFAHKQDDADLRFDIERNFDYVLDNLGSVDKVAVSVEK